MSATQSLATTKWAIDPAHTEVQFKVKHLVIATVSGSFKTFAGTVETEEEDFNNAKIDFTIEAGSIDTGNSDRDNHLKSDDFFAVDKHPSIAFSNGVLKKTSGNDYKLTGQLSLRGVSKEITLDVEYGGSVVDPWGNTKVGFEINGKINRKDFGLTWNAPIEAGGVVVSEEVKLHINAELAKA